ncbi:MAG: DUF1365 domain-containing protein [Vicinamibacterales bacterium]
MKSCLYVGHIAHRRFMPRPHRFRYRLYMNFIDLAELPTLFDRFWLWSARRPALAWFRRGDFHGRASQPLDEAIRDRVAAETGQRPTGPVRLLTHLRYAGYSFNPVSFYFVYDAEGERVEHIVAEITNTPWKERHCYVLPVPATGEWHWHFQKQFHVSPFLPMDMEYDWRFSSPGESLAVHMQNWRDGRKVFDATLALSRRPMRSSTLARALLAVPLASVQVIAQIHWQALRLWLKRVPVQTHPDELQRVARGG